MSIRNNIEKVMEEIKGGNKERGEAVRRLAVNAIKRGEGTKEWQDYMDQFSRTSGQLARLMATDTTQDDYDMDVARTYLVGNGTCGAVTTGYHLLQGVDDKLDEGLADR